MKLHAKLTVLLVAGTVLVMGSCQRNEARRDATTRATPPATDSAAQLLADVADPDAGFSEVRNREWILSAIRTAQETVILDRDGHTELGFGDIFTLRFEDAMVFGTAMPNTYRGPYTLTENHGLAFGPKATTMMAAFMEPEEITENEFFAHMGNVSRWDLVDGNLELHTATEDGTETVLIFVGN